MSRRNRSKITVTLSWPIEFKLLRSGERVIADSGPGEVEIEFREDRVADDSWVVALGNLFDEFEASQRRKLSRSRCALRRRGQNTTAAQDDPNKGGGPEAR